MAHGLNVELKANGHPTFDVVLYLLFDRPEYGFVSQSLVEYMDSGPTKIEGTPVVTMALMQGTDFAPIYRRHKNSVIMVTVQEGR